MPKVVKKKVVSRKKVPKKKVKKKLSAAELKQRREQRNFKIKINTIFKNAGFAHIATRDKEFEFKGKTGEIDAIYLHENTLIISEDTCATSETLHNHFRKKSDFYEFLNAHKNEFVEFLMSEFGELSEKCGEYEASDFTVIYLYCSRHQMDQSKYEDHKHIKFMSYTSLRYFEALTKTIHRSAKYEIFKFLGLKLCDIGFDQASQKKKQYSAFVLPEKPSGFPDDFKIITFYIDPQSLIELSYVLRKDSWLDSQGLYQRMLIKNKIKSMRAYLVEENHVYINNIIVSLPHSVKFSDEEGNTVNPGAITSTSNLQILLPTEFNLVGLIDGQHRVYSYHEGEDKHEGVIKTKRVKQQLLVTGVIFPKGIDPAERIKKEAQIFLEINDKQSRAKGDLKQAIQTIVDPYNPIAIAKSIVSRLAKKGPLSGLLEDHYFGEGKIKTTSIVSYALQHIVTTDEDEMEHSLYKLWEDQNKQFPEVDNAESKNLYVQFCVKEINIFLNAFKYWLSNDLWSTDRKVSKALTTTTINGLIFCLRRLIVEGKTGDFDHYCAQLEQLKLNFKATAKFPYKSSHWRALGDKIYDDCFSYEEP